MLKCLDPGGGGQEPAISITVVESGHGTAAAVAGGCRAGRPIAMETPIRADDLDFGIQDIVVVVGSRKGWHFRLKLGLELCFYHRGREAVISSVRIRGGAPVTDPTPPGFELKWGWSITRQTRVLPRIPKLFAHVAELSQVVILGIGKPDAAVSKFEYMLDSEPDGCSKVFDLFVRGGAQFTGIVARWGGGEEAEVFILVAVELGGDGVTEAVQDVRDVGVVEAALLAGGILLLASCSLDSIPKRPVGRQNAPY